MRYSHLVFLLSIALLGTPVRAQGGPKLDHLLGQWAAAGSPSPEVVAAVFGEIDIMNAAGELDLLSKVANASKLRPDVVSSVFETEVRKALDDYRYARVQEVLDKVYARYGGGLEAAVRTGSSGIRHLNPGAAPGSLSGYKLLLSDDDISFIGTKAVDAAKMFNSELKAAGLTRVKVNGFDLLSLKNVRNLDMVALDLMEPEKFLGASGLGGIKQEMLQKGAVIAKNTGGGMVATAEPLAAFVEAKKSLMLSELLDDKAIAGMVEKYGSMTMVASCERQIVTAHAGWSHLSPSDRVKYVLRQSKALRTSGGLLLENGMTAALIEEEIASLESLKKLVATMPPEEFSTMVDQKLLSMRKRNVRLAFDELPTKLNPILALAEADGRSLAANPEVRKTIEELATGFALLDLGGLQMTETEMLTRLRLLAKGNKDIYDVLYTGYRQGQDLVDVMLQWQNTGGSRASFVELLTKTAERTGKRALTQSQKLAKAGKAEAQSLSVLEEMFGTPEGESLFLQMAKNPAAKKYLIAALGTAGGALVLKKMYDSWMQGDAKFRQDLSGVVMTFIELVPGGLSIGRLYTEGIDATTAFLLVKDRLYFTPWWPLVLTGDVIAMGWDVGSTMRAANYQDGLVDVFVYSGQFERSGDGYKFVALALPGGPPVTREGLRAFLFETKAVRVNHALAGKSYIIGNLSAASATVLDKYYVANDRVLQEMRTAAEQQLTAINRSAAWGGLVAGNPFAAALGLGSWMAGTDSICKSSRENWCKVFGALRKQMDSRREILIDQSMIPQLIEMAEAKRQTLDAPNLYEAKLAEMQTEFERLRGTASMPKKLEVNLVEKVKAAAAAKAAERATDTGEEKAVKSGQVWQSAYISYKRILAISESMPQNIAAKTAYTRTQILQFRWKGDAAEDLRKAEQSKAGFASLLRRISVDVRAAKQGEPSITEPVDVEAFGLLGEVAFGYRVVLDESDQAEPAQTSPFFLAYAQSLEKVKQLYARSATFQAALNKGAAIIKEKDTLLAEQATGLELKFTDPALQKEMQQGLLTLNWSAIPAGEFRPNPQSAAVRFIPGGLEPAKIAVRVVRNTGSKEQGTVIATMPVSVGPDFLTMALTPAAPEAHQMFAVEASVPDRYLGIRGLHYRWQCVNCTVEDTDRFKTGARSPEKGGGTVTVSVLMDDGNGKRTVLATRTMPFSVGAKEAPAPEGMVTASVAGLKAELAPGAKAEVYARGFARGGKPATGDIKVVWNSKPAIAMTPKETTGEARAKLQLPGPGVYVIWGEIRIAGEKAGETDRFEMKVKGSEFTVTLSASPQSVKPGQSATITADVAGGGTPPLVYNWTGAGGDGSHALFSSMKGGAFPVSVVVTDASGRVVSASLSMRVNSVEGKIAGLPNRVYYGTRQTISGQVEGDTIAPVAPPVAPPKDPCVGKPRSNNPYDECNEVKGIKMVSTVGSGSPSVVLPSTVALPTQAPAAAPVPALPPPVVGGEIQFIYQSDIGVAFDPPQSAGPTSVLFNHMPRNGKLKIWAQIVKKEGEIFSTVGETPQQEIEIAPPEFEITFDPAAQMMGKEVKATIKTRPVIEDKLLTYRWSTPENNNRMEYAQNASVIGFTAKTKLPVKLLAAADSPYNERVGSVTGEFTSSQYVVEAKVTGTMGPQPMIWQEKVGLVPVPSSSFAADQTVQAEAAIKGEPAPAEVRWSWTTNEGTTLLSAPTARQVQSSRHETGQAELSVEARDANGVLLGRAKAGFAVTVSADQLSRRPLAAKAVADPALLGSGDNTTLRASAEGGKPPYNYAWSGAAQGAGQALSYRAGKAGKLPVTLTVSDAEGKQATATVTLDVRAVVLPVELTADRASITAGETARLTASSKTARPPLRYQWTAGVTGDGPTVQFRAGASGSQEVQVTVTDSRGNVGTKKLALSVKPLALTFAPHASRIAFGEKLPLAVNLPAGDWTTVFHANPEIDFAPREAADARTIATVSRRPGVRIWAEILKDGKPAGKVAEETLDVTLPQFELVFDPAKAGVGEEVTATVRAASALDAALYKFDWKRMPASARVDAPGRIVFSAKDYNPVEFIVDAVSNGGDSLGEISKQFVPTTLSLQARIIGPVPPLPRLMRQGQLVEVSDAYAVNQRVKISAGFEIKPPEGVQYSWALPRGCSSDSAKSEAEITVYRTSTGDCLVSVVARTRKGGKIGEASLRVPVTLSQADIDRSKLEEARNDATLKLAEAEKLAQAKRFEEARKLIEDAAKVEPDKASVTRTRVATIAIGFSDRAVLELDFSSGAGYLDSGQRIHPGNPDLAFAKAQLSRWQRDWQQAQSLASQFDAMLAAHRLPSAEATLASVYKLVTPIPAAPKITPWYNALAARARAARPEYLAFLEPLRKRIPESLKARAYPQANSLCQQALQRELYPDHEQEIRNWMQQAQANPAPAVAVQPAPPAKRRSFEDVIQSTVKVLDAVGQAADQISRSTGAPPSTPTSPSPAPAPAASVRATGKVVDNFNTGGCAFTDLASFNLPEATHLERVSLWYSWESNETPVPYTLSSNGRTLRTGQLVRGGCDPHQQAWCNATDAINLDVPAGTYTVRTDRRRVCQNAGTGGNGMMTAQATRSTSAPVAQAPAPASPTPVAASKPPATPAPAPVAATPAPAAPRTPTPAAPAPNPCAGKPRTNNPFDDCNQVTITKSVSTGNNGTGKPVNPLVKTLATTVKNESSQYVHIFVDGETFGPQNRLSPGESRTVELAMPASGRIRFTVGRDGTVIEQRNWDGDPSDLSRAPSVTFSSGGKLVVVTVLR